MSNEIKVNKEIFQKTINSINNIINDYENIKSEISNANEGLKGYWKGKSSKAFFKESENIATTFNDYIEGLTALGNDINMVYQNFENTDQELSKISKGE